MSSKALSRLHVPEVSAEKVAPGIAIYNATFQKYTTRTTVTPVACIVHRPMGMHRPSQGRDPNKYHI